MTARKMCVRDTLRAKFVDDETAEEVVLLLIEEAVEKDEGAGMGWNTPTDLVNGDLDDREILRALKCVQDQRRDLYLGDPDGLLTKSARSELAKMPHMAVKAVWDQFDDLGMI